MNFVLQRKRRNITTPPPYTILQYTVYTVYILGQAQCPEPKKVERSSTMKEDENGLLVYLLISL